MKRILCLLTLAALVFTSCGQKKDPNFVSLRWDFDNLDGWTYGHQDTATVNLNTVEDGILKVVTRAGTYDRPKYRTVDTFTSGIYKWRTYISDIAPGDQTSIGSWIYCDDHHEIDFEVGPGRSEIRERIGAADDEYLACMTNQDNPPKSGYVAIKGGWHDFAIKLDVVDGHYVISWIIDDIVRQTHEVTFGPEYGFHIFVSVENLKFIGDHVATQDNYGLYDWVSFEGQKWVASAETEK